MRRREKEKGNFNQMNAMVSWDENVSAAISLFSIYFNGRFNFFLFLRMMVHS